MRPIFLFLFLASPAILWGQLSGSVTGPDGEPLPFASVYVKGTTRGTTTNVAGDYSLSLDPGNYQIVFRYIGLKEEVRELSLGAEPVQLDVRLQAEAIALAEVEVRADAEDPAYAIIRKAMARRTYYRDLIEAYECEVYVKGNIKFLDAPERFMGQEIGDLQGVLDTSRQGILYLAESQSTLFFQQPDRLKEKVKYTKVSGDDNGFGFNSALAMDFSLYKNTITMGRQIVSPIAANAMAYYDYRLIGAGYDPEGRLINKIELLPKRSEDPVYGGFVYIVEDLWLIQSVDLFLLPGAMKQPGLDTLWLRQVHVPVEGPDRWRVFSQDIRFTAGLFGFRIGGRFTGVYSGYDLAPDFPRGFFDNEIYRVEEGANETTMAYWDTIRPLPLTRAERVDYIRKDSLQELRKSRPYLDSIDAENNRFQPINLLVGYQYNRSHAGKSFSIGSPLTTVQFNTVQGFNADLNLSYRREFDREGLRWFELQPSLNYGFSDGRLRGQVGATYRFRQIDRRQISIQAGVVTRQFNAEDPISKTLNTLYSLFGRRNYLKLYEHTFGRISYQQELLNGVFLQAFGEYGRRRALVNHSDYSFGDAEGRAYSANDPQDPDNYSPAFATHRALVLGASLRLRIGQKYIRYPERKFIMGSDLPDLWIDYRGGFPILGSSVRYDRLSFRIQENYLPVGVGGHLEFQLEWGTFLNRDSLFFMDYRHVNGNQTLFGNPDRYLDGFKLLPYYTRSTTQAYWRAQVEHHFEGFITDRIPGFRKLGWLMVAGASLFHTQPEGTYVEFSLGFDNIGIGPLRILRLDGVAGYQQGEDWNFGFLIGLKLP